MSKLGASVVLCLPVVSGGLLRDLLFIKPKNCFLKTAEVAQ